MNKSAYAKHTVVLSFISLTLGACASSSSHPDAQVAVKQLSSAVCQKLAACLPGDAGTAAGPFMSVDECISKGTMGNMASGQSSCTQSQLDACVSDIQKEDCKAYDAVLVTGSVSELPSSCQGC